MDNLATLLSNHPPIAHFFHRGPFCGANAFVADGSGGVQHMVQSGTVRFEHDDGTVIVASVPTLVFYPSGMSHRLTVAPPADSSLLCARIAFDGGHDNLLARALPAVIDIALEDAPLLGRTAALLFAEADVVQRGHGMILNSLCHVLVAQIVRYLFDRARLSPGVLAGLADPRLSRALQAIHRAPAQPWQVDTLATEAGMSRSKFAEHFVSVVGTTPARYLTQWRMSVAQDLLRAGMSASAAGDAVGYASQPAFTRAFVGSTGVSPRRWQASQQRGQRAR